MNKVASIILLSLAFAACESETGEKETPSGYKYTILKEADTELPKDGQFMVIHMQYRDQNDSIWVDTQELGRPSMVVKQDSVWRNSDQPLEQVLINASKGDSLRITLSATLLFENSQMPPTVSPSDSFTIFMGIQEVFNEEEMQAWQQEMADKQRMEAEKQLEEQLATDRQILEEYFSENNIDVQTTESGLSYVITEEGSGESPQPGDRVRVNYTGHVLEGEFFDTSDREVAQEKGLFNETREYGPLGFTIGQGQVIRGWDEGISLLNEGGEATLYVPSTLAYGPRQRGALIGPNSILVFDVELVEVIKNENQ